MAEVTTQLNNNSGSFIVTEGSEQLGELTFSIDGNHLTAHHTEVSDQHQGKGVAKQLLNALVQYAKDNQLQVIPMCSYVQTSFMRHPELYREVWKE